MIKFPKQEDRVVHFGDENLSHRFETLADEFKEIVVREAAMFDVEFDWSRVIHTDLPPFKDRFDYLFFDWGGMSLGNSLMQSFCRQILEHSENNPNTIYVMISMFTAQAMEDAMRELPDAHNIFLSVEKFCEYLKKKEAGEAA